MEEGKEEGKELNAKQLLFCKLYVSKEFFGNGVQSYCEAYNIDYNDVKQHAQARSSASLLLNNPNVSKHINNMLDEAGLNDQFVDKRLLFLISQSDDKSTALQAIKEYNKLRQRITDKLQLDVKVYNVSMDLD